MGGQGSGRKPNPMNVVKKNWNDIQRSTQEIFIPNLSGVKHEIKEGTSGISTDDLAEGSTNLYYSVANAEGDFLKLDGSNANQAIKIGTNAIQWKDNGNEWGIGASTNQFAIQNIGKYAILQDQLTKILLNGDPTLQITSADGEIDFDNENLTTTGTLDCGDITCGNIGLNNAVTTFQEPTAAFSRINFKTPNNIHLVSFENSTITFALTQTTTENGWLASSGDLSFGVSGTNKIMKLYTGSGDIRLGAQTTNYVSIDSAGDMVFTGGSGLPFAEIYVADNSTAQTIGTGTTYTKSTAFASNGESNNCTADATNDKITITKVGRYKVNVTLNGKIDTANTRVDFAIFKGGSICNNIKGFYEFVAANRECGGSACGIIDVTSANTDIDLRIRHDDGGDVDVTCVNVNLNVVQIGGT